MKTKDKQLGLPIDSKKKVTIVKCFICNQMFYSQITFDTHMRTHQSKLNKNVPEQIQRKTQQSFGIKKRQSINKKNTTLESISPNQLMQKKMNKTQKIQKISKIQNEKIERPFSKQSISILTKKDEEINEKNKSFSPQKETNQKEVQEINEALRQSSIIMNQIMFLTECQSHNQQQEIVSSQKQVDSSEEIQKDLNQRQFKNKMNSKDVVNLVQIQNFVLKTNFQTKSLQNCQIQLEHLNNLMKFAQNDQISKSKIVKIKYKILQEVIRQVCSKIENYQKQVQCKIQQKGQTLDEKIRKVQNTQMRNCTQCYSSIEYGEECILKGIKSFHCECFYENAQRS